MLRERQTLLDINQNLDQLEALPQSVVAYRRNLSAGETLPPHQHRRAQFVYASAGVMTVTTPTAAFVIPPERAVWVPGGVVHQIDARSDVAMQTLYVEPSEAIDLPTEVCVLHVEPLLKELIIKAVAWGPRYEPGSPQSRIIDVILDEIRTLPMASLSLPLPSDPRMLRITQILLSNPADARTIGEWAKEVGTSKRTLGRLFTLQTGMSFRTWRQQRRLLRALELLATGAQVTTVAMELGYDNTSAFIAMFRRCLGTTPKHYLNVRMRNGTN